jgi:hypothetical protein
MRVNKPKKGAMIAVDEVRVSNEDHDHSTEGMPQIWTSDNVPMKAGISERKLCQSLDGNLIRMVTVVRAARSGRRLMGLRQRLLPRPKPRKQAIRTKFLKYAKIRISEDTHRMSMSSKKSTRKLTMNNVR